MKIVLMYGIVAAFIGLLPGSSPFLLLLEVAMVYHLSFVNKRPFSLVELGIIWTILIGIGGALQVLVGELLFFAKPVIAFMFVICFGWLVNKYYQMENQRHSEKSDKN
jgi:hypothetical protein